MTSEKRLEFVLRYYREGVFSPQKGYKRFRKRALAARRGVVFRYVAVAAALALLLAGGVTLYQWRVNRWEEVTAKAFVLPDQTVVRLQEGSSLSFQPRRFHKERTVKLIGTAFFEVAHGGSVFEVQSGVARVRDLGTQFQFDASRNAVYVNEGRVLFIKENAEQGLEMSKGAYAILPEGADMPILSSPEVPNPAAWATGIVVYDAVPLETVLKELSSLFGEPLRLSSRTGEQPSLTAEFRLSDGLPLIVSYIESALNVKIRQDE